MQQAICNLKKIEGKQSYDGNHFTVSYDEIVLVDDMNTVCVIVYETEHNIVVLVKASKYARIQNYIIYLLIDDYNDELQW